MAYRDDHDAAIERIDALEHELKQADAERKQAEAERDRIAVELARERRAPPVHEQVAIAIRTPGPVEPLTAREIEWLHQDLRKADGRRKTIDVVGLVAFALLAFGSVLAALASATDEARGVALFFGGLLSIVALIQVRTVRVGRRSQVVEIVCASPDRIRRLDLNGGGERGNNAKLTIRIDNGEQLVLSGSTSEIRRLHERLHRLHVEALPHLLPSGARAPAPGSGQP